MAASKVIQLQLTDFAQFLSSDKPAVLGGGMDSDVSGYLFDETNAVHYKTPVKLHIVLPKDKVRPNQQTMAEEATSTYFAYQAVKARRELAATFKRGRRSLVIAIVFITIFAMLAYWVGNAFSDLKVYVNALLAICAWVALWTPIESFLFVWWPIARQAKVYDKLSSLDIAVMSSDETRDQGKA